MTSNKQKWICYENSILAYCNSKKWWIKLIVLTGIAFSIDILSIKSIFEVVNNIVNFDCLKIYYSLKDFFSYDFSVLVAIMVVIWTFTVGLSTFFLDKLNNRFYGIRIADIIEARNYMHKLIYLAIGSIVQLVLMIGCVVFRCWFTLCMDCVLMLNTMIVAFCFILTNLSKTMVISYIRLEIQDMVAKKKLLSETPLFSALLRNLNYSTLEDMDLIIQLLVNEISHLSLKNIGNKKIIYDWGYKISQIILTAGKQNSITILKYWFLKSKEMQLQKGIISALLDEEKATSYDICNEFIEAMDGNVREWYLWILVYELYQSNNIGKSWRKFNAKLTVSHYIIYIKNDDIRIVLEFWGELNKDYKKVNSLYKFLDEMEGNDDEGNFIAYIT